MTLKAREAFDTLFPRVNINENTRVNIKKLADNLVQGAYLQGSSMMLLRQEMYSGRSHYDNIPRPFRYYFSEYSFSTTRFSWDHFYDYQTPREEIYKDYCELFLNKYENKSVQRFYKRLQRDHPEIFI